MQPYQTSAIWPRQVLVIVLLALAGCASPPPPASPKAAQDALPLEVERGDGNCHIRLTGPLDDEAVRSLRYVMTKLEPAGCRSKRVLLDLQGGRIGSAITLGALIKNRGYDTQVQPGSTCLTPCLLAFAAGRQRLMLPSVPPTRIGFSQIPPDADFGHQSCETELLSSQALTLTRYLRAMLPLPTANAVYQKLTAATCQRTEYLGPTDTLTLGLATTIR